jgi:hypothetical protein
MVCLIGFSLLLGNSLFSAEYDLPAGRLPGGVRWTRASVGVEGGIPDSSAMVVYTNYTSSATAAEINVGIQNCPSNQVVALGSGSFTCSTGLLMKTGVVLKGAGRTNTVLLFTGGNGNGFLRGLVEWPGPFTGDASGTVKTWSGGLTQGSNPIAVNNNTSLSVGHMVAIDQLDDAAIGVSGSETFLSRASGARAQAQVERITAISGTDITLTHPVSMTNYVSGNTPQLVLNGNPVVRSGVESLTVSNAAAVAKADFNFMFYGSWDCWVKDVLSWRAEASHVKTYWAGRIEVRDSHFRDTWDYASESYGVNISYYASWCLVENNIFQQVTTPMFNWGAGGDNIFGYNFAITNRYDVSPAWQINVMGTHGKHQTMCLYEGNYMANVEFDHIHGSSSHNTAFRNRLTGKDIGNAALTTQTFPFIAERNNRYLSAVANILGTDSYHTGYRLQNESSSIHDEKSIFILGYAGTTLSLTDYDTGVTNTILILGNYNTVDDAIPAVESLGGDTLASSWYYDSKPAWFGDRTWPWVDPASPTLALSTKGYTNFPAGYRYEYDSDPPSEGGGGGGSPMPIHRLTLNNGNLTLSGGVQLRQ